MEGYIGTIGSKVTAEVKMVNIFEYQDYKFSYYGVPVISTPCRTMPEMFLSTRHLLISHSKPVK